MQKIDIVIPYYNRSDLIQETLRPIHNDSRINKIIIVDDKSNMCDLVKLNDICINYEKVEIKLHDNNLGMFYNKRRAVEYSTTNYCILLDSDNIIDSSFLDAIYKEDWKTNTIFTSSFARPNFDMTDLSNVIYTKNNVKEIFDKYKFGSLCLNVGNYFINKNEYLKVHNYDNYKYGAADVIFLAYLWFNSNNQIKVVDKLEYFHRVHDNSTYSIDIENNLKYSKQVKQLILNL